MGKLRILEMQRRGEFGMAEEIKKSDLRAKYIRQQVVAQGVPEDEAEIIAALTYP